MSAIGLINFLEAENKSLRATLEKTRGPMTTSSTQIGYLDLAAFYLQAQNVRNNLKDKSLSFTWLAGDLAEKLLCVIDAIRDDGLDPRWHPERDALVGLQISGPFAPEKPNRYEIRNWNADDIISGLRERGYKIVKDDAV